MHVWKVARYTCSSPLYFGEYDNYIDTGVLCKNLCNIGLERINSYHLGLEQDTADPISVVVSLGDGRLQAQQLGTASQLSTYYLGNITKVTNPMAKELLGLFQNMVALYTSAAVSNYMCITSLLRCTDIQLMFAEL